MKYSLLLYVLACLNCVRACTNLIATKSTTACNCNMFPIYFPLSFISSWYYYYLHHILTFLFCNRFTYNDDSSTRVCQSSSRLVSIVRSVWRTLSLSCSNISGRNKTSYLGLGLSSFPIINPFLLVLGHKRRSRRNR